MISVRRLWAFPAFAAAAVLALGVSACSGGDDGDDDVAAPEADHLDPAPTPTAPPRRLRPRREGVVRVVDGDSSKPVRTARSS